MIVFELKLVSYIFRMLSSVLRRKEKYNLFILLVLLFVAVKQSYGIIIAEDSINGTASDTSSEIIERSSQIHICSHPLCRCEKEAATEISAIFCTCDKVNLKNTTIEAVS